ncbi:MAG: RNA polymerase sigma factor SigZ [Chitinophagales bacterium]
MNTAIQDIWKDLHQELQKFIFGKVKDTSASEDILQEVFVKIQLKVHTLKDCTKLTSWVYQITRNTITDFFRKQKSNPHASIEELDLLAEEEEPLFEGLSNCINSKIGQLPDKYKEALLLTVFKDYSQKELAEYLGISYSGTKSRVQRAKEKLKDLVKDCDNVETDSLGNIVDHG